MVECMFCKYKVVGSNPTVSTHLQGFDMLHLTRNFWRQITFRWVCSQLTFKGRLFLAWKVLFFCLFWSNRFWRYRFHYFFYASIVLLRPIYGIIFYKSLRRKFHRRRSFPFWISPVRLKRKATLWLAKGTKKGSAPLSVNLLNEVYKLNVLNKKVRATSLAMQLKNDYYRNGALYYRVKNYRW